MPQKLKIIISLFFSAFLFQGCSDGRSSRLLTAEEIAVNYLHQRGFSDLKKLNDSIPLNQFASQRFKCRGDFCRLKDTVPSEYQRCAESKICFDILLEGNRAKFLFYNGKIGPKGHQRSLDVAVIVDSVYQHPIGLSTGFYFKKAFIPYENNYVLKGRDFYLKEKIIANIKPFNDSLGALLPHPQEETKESH